MADLSPEEDSSDLYLENNEEKNLVQINDPTLVKWKDFSDYRFLEYYLKTSLGVKCPVQILAIHNVKNEEAFSRTEEIGKNTQWTYGWYKLKKEHLTQVQSDNEIKENERTSPGIIGLLKTKGFTEKDRKFTVGNISSLMTNGNDNYFVLCKLFIGNSSCIKEEKKSKEVNSIDKKIPPYFNSYKILTPENMTLQLDHKDFNDIKEKSFIYDILKPNYICPLYVVKVQTLTDSQQRNNDNYFCIKCLQKEAEVFCRHCGDYFDLECYNAKHKPKNQKELNHGNYQLVPHKQKEGICVEHEDQDASYYCLVCKKPICTGCKIKVNKNEKESLHYSHPVKDIYQAFEEELPNTYLSIEIRKRAVKMLKKIKKTVKTLIEKQIMIEKEIEHEFRDENDVIQSLTKEAKLKHFSVSSELNEMKKHMTNMNSYFSKCYKSMEEAKLYPEALWIKDNHEEVINDIYKNFSVINLDYKVDKDSFKRIKQTELRIIKKIDIKKMPLPEQDEIEEQVNDIIRKDDQFTLTKKIVSLKTEKQEAKIKSDQNDQQKKKKNFESEPIDHKYVLNETLVNKQNEKAYQDLERQNKKKEDETKKENQKRFIQNK